MKKSGSKRGRKPGQPIEVWKEILVIYGLLIGALIWNWW